VLGALATILFRELIDYFQSIVFGERGDLVALVRATPWYVRLVVPGVGGLLAGGFLYVAERLSSNERHGEYMEAVTIGNGHIPIVQTLIRTVSSLCSIVSGASIGREGPMVQLAALCASIVGRIRKLNTESLRTLVACGAAAGITSAYNAPIAGAFFVAEIVLGTVIAERMTPLIVASVVANLTMRSFPGYHAPYMPPPLGEISALELLLFPCLGVFLGVAAPAYLYLLKESKRRISRLRWPKPIVLSVGGMSVGAISIFFPESLGNGYSVVNDLIRFSLPWEMLLLLLICKVVATAISSGSGAVGGVFTPTVLVGAALGSLAGGIASIAFSAVASSHSTFVLVGMGGFLAATTQAPLMAILMIFEMTLSYGLMLPLMLSSIIAFAVCRSITENPMYAATARLNRQRLASARARGLRVGDLLKTTEQTIPMDASLLEVQEKFLRLPVKYLYLVDKSERLQGFIALSDFNSLVLQKNLSPGATAKTIARHDVPIVHPNDSAPVVLQAFLRHGGERLPVEEEGQQRRFLGVVSKADFLAKIESLIS
jgi:CIC family chloride channel protein